MMSRLLLLCAVGALALTQVAGCATSETMTPQAREGVELRRYCEQHPQDVAKCLGFLGFH